MDLCENCSSIPFAKLASENEDALLHRSSVESLFESANKCKLCAWVADAPETLLLELQHAWEELGGSLLLLPFCPEGFSVKFERGGRREHFRLDFYHQL
jgi:hypothetical protein